MTGMEMRMRQTTRLEPLNCEQQVLAWNRAHDVTTLILCGEELTWPLRAAYVTGGVAVVELEALGRVPLAKLFAVPPNEVLRLTEALACTACGAAPTVSCRGKGSQRGHAVRHQALGRVIEQRLGRLRSAEQSLEGDGSRAVLGLITPGARLFDGLLREPVVDADSAPRRGRAWRTRVSVSQIIACRANVGELAGLGDIPVPLAADALRYLAAAATHRRGRRELAEALHPLATCDECRGSRRTAIGTPCPCCLRPAVLLGTRLAAVHLADVVACVPDEVIDVALVARLLAASDQTHVLRLSGAGWAYVLVQLSGSKTAPVINLSPIDDACPQREESR